MKVYLARTKAYLRPKPGAESASLGGEYRCLFLRTVVLCSTFVDVSFPLYLCLLSGLMWKMINGKLHVQGLA